MAEDRERVQGPALICYDTYGLFPGLTAIIRPSVNNLPKSQLVRNSPTPQLQAVSKIVDNNQEQGNGRRKSGAYVQYVSILRRLEAHLYKYNRWVIQLCWATQLLSIRCIFEIAGNYLERYARASLILAIAFSTFSQLLKALMRIYPSPHFPNPAPGVHTTAAFSNRRSKNFQESERPSIQI